MRWRALVLGLALAPVACELTSTSITEPADELLVEAYVIVSSDADPFQPGGVRGMVLVHGIVGSSEVSSGLPDVTVTITAQGGSATALAERAPVECAVDPLPEHSPGRCYVADLPSEVQPGSTVALRVEATDGRAIIGATTLPQDFEMIHPAPSGEFCTAPPNTRLAITWSTSPGAWAYPSEVRFDGLASQLALSDPDFADLQDPLVLFGLAISDADTTITFPNEFGLFDRFDDNLLGRALVEIQDGLPDGTRSTVTMGAADRNFVNWARGGNFNPSGPVRVPSVSGDGFGVFGSMVLKTVGIVIGQLGPGQAACTGVATGP